MGMGKRNPYFEKLFEVGYIGKLKIRNRIVMSPMGMHFAGINGEVTDKTIAHYTERAKGGVGLITVGITDMMPTPQRYNVRLLSIGEHRLLRGHYELVESVHSYSTKISLQLGHIGSQMSMAAAGGKQTLSPSGIQQFFVDGHAYEPPRAMTTAEIYEIAQYFADAAGRAKKAGYDMVEIHGAHGYLVGSFMSPLYNKRKDEFGGTLENRMRFPVEIIKRVKKVVGEDFPISIRISADEFLDGGITLKESPRMAKILEEAGVSLINVSSGNHQTLHRSNDIARYPEGLKWDIWKSIKESVGVVTIAGGGNRTPEFCEKILAAGIADFVSLGRQMIADPCWAKKAKDGRVEDINKCISCLMCLYDVGGEPRIWPHCSVNATWGRETYHEFAEYKPSMEKKKVFIIGGGPAGMEAARVASLRGHDVTLYEKKGELGGQLLLASIPPGKKKMLWPRDYLTIQLAKQQVKIKLNTEVTPEMVREESPDIVIVATGAQPILPNIPGIKGKNVFPYREVLEGSVEFRSKKVVILGGGMVGCETAEFLSEKDYEVTVVEMLEEVALDMDPLNRKGLLDALNEYRTKLLVNREVKEITDTGVIVLNKITGEKETISTEVMVIAMGSESVSSLAEAFAEGDYPEHYIVGDSRSPRRLFDAIYEGSLVGRRI
jgi:2,4-dienoyl-CoA reductase-like NADH-dependent reductase (Old Yellow Enzyme family)/thioredoxin reductase